MTIARRIEEGLLVLDVGEETSYDELEEHFRAGFVDPAFVPAAGVLVLINGPGFIPSIDELRRASHFFDELSRTQRTRIALVTPSTLHYGLGRMLQAYCDSLGLELRAFHDQLTARAWLAT